MPEPRRLKILPISAELVPHLFQRDDAASIEAGRLVRITGWPADGRIVGGGYDIIRDRYEFQVESATFPPVPPGGELPRFDLTVTAVDFQQTAIPNDQDGRAGNISPCGNLNTMTPRTTP